MLVITVAPTHVSLVACYTISSSYVFPYLWVSSKAVTGKKNVWCHEIPTWIKKIRREDI